MILMVRLYYILFLHCILESHILTAYTQIPLLSLYNDTYLCLTVVVLAFIVVHTNFERGADPNKPDCFRLFVCATQLMYGCEISFDLISSINYNGAPNCYM